MIVSVTCPYCGIEQQHEINDQPYIKQLVTCTGCDRYLVVEAHQELLVTIQTVEELNKAAVESSESVRVPK